MWKIGDLKARGKVAFKANFWKCVLIMVIFSVIGGVIGGVSSGSIMGNPEIQQALVNGDMETYYALYMAKMGPIMCVSGIIGIFVLGPLGVGAGRFFLCNSYAPAEVAELGFPFKGGNYVRCLVATFVSALLCALGTIVIIPGIILPYSYRLVPYIIADDPEISAIDALKKSRQMMKGHKWHTFLLDLSFIGWILLSALTLYILLIFYVAPYMAATDAELYRTIKGDAGIPVETIVAPTQTEGYVQQPVVNEVPTDNSTDGTV